MLNKLRLNGKIKKQQMVRLAGIGLGLFVLLMILMIATKRGHSSPKEEKTLDFTGVVDSQFSEADTQSAMTAQQLELEGLKKQIASLTEGIKTLREDNQVQVSSLAQKMVEEMTRVKTESDMKLAEAGANHTVLAANQGFYPGGKATDGSFQNQASSNRLNKARGIHSVSFKAYKNKSRLSHRNPNNYVPSGTFAKAVVLGGVDADASVDGQNKNNGVMLFKVINPGTLPNGKRSHLAGCLITASAYGDISSERAYVKLDKISCAFDGMPIIDKSVTGWAFYSGKVGIKGVPLMRDGKVVAWAGFSGALSGVAQAAQYAQSVQNFGAYGGATSIVPSSNIGPFAAYGGAAKAADKLSEYYIKRAEQYHPLVQVGAGNQVNIVFKDGFYLDDSDEEHREYSRPRYQEAQNKEPVVPLEVLSQLNQAQLGQEVQESGESQ